MKQDQRKKSKENNKVVVGSSLPELFGGWLERTAFYVLLAIVAIFPFVYSRETKSNFILPKQWFFEPAVWLTLFLWATSSFLKGKLSLVKSSLYSAVCLFFAVMTLSLIRAEPAYEASVEYRAWLFGGIAFFLAANLVRTRSRIAMTLGAVALAGFMEAMWGILQYLKLDDVLRIDETIGTTGNANYLGAMLAMFVFPFVSTALAIVASIKEMYIKVAVAIFAVLLGLVYLIALLYTDCQAAYIGAGIGFIAYAGAMIYKSGLDKRKLAKGSLIAVAVGIVFLLASWGISGKNPKAFLNLPPLATKGRIIMWRAAILMVKDYPILGTGIGTYPYNYLNYLSKSHIGRNVKAYLGLIQYDEKPHSAYLQIWSDTGTAGLLSLLLIIGIYFLVALKDLKNEDDRGDMKQMLGITTGQLAFLATMGVSSLTAISPFREYLWIFFGLFVAQRAASGRAQTFEISFPGSKVAILGLIGAIALVGLIAGSRRSLRLYDASVLWEQGINASDEGNDAKAYELYTRALEITPEDHKLLFYRGSLLLKIADDLGGADKEKFNQAGMQDLLEAAKGYSDINLYSNLGKTYRDMGEFENALYWYKKAAATGLHYGNAYGNLGATYVAMGKVEEAQEALLESVSVDPKNPWALFNLGLVEMSLKNYSDAAKYFERYVRLIPTTVDGRNNQGLALLEMGRATEALHVLIEADRLKPGYAKVLNNMGVAYMALGDPERAAFYWKSALEADPDNESAKRKLEELNKITP